MKFLQKYICEVICVINLIFIAPNHDFSIWWQKPVMNDAMGYYSYLPAVFVYQDLTYNFIYEPWKKHYPEIAHEEPKDMFAVKFKGKQVNKYPPGVAYFQSPFFILGHLTAKITGKDADGYSNIYMYFMCIGAIFWQYVFLRILSKIFEFYRINKTSFVITSLLLCFGTNIWFYTQHFGTYSHLYTLLSISLFYYGGIRFFSAETENNKAYYFAIMLIGFSLALITRNINVIALLLLPCMGFNWRKIADYLTVLKNKKAIAGLLVSGILIFSMFLLWKLQSGYWFVDSYPDEHFYWSKPQIFKSLFSAHKGWFTYTPIALVGLFGLRYASKKLALNFLLVLTLVIYITSSWWCWDYGTAFSMRAYIDWYLFVAIGLGFLFHHIQQKPNLFYSILIICTLLSAVNLLQSSQFMRGIISGHSQGIEYTLRNFFRLRPKMQYIISKNVTEETVRNENNFNGNSQQPFTEVSEASPFSKGIKMNMLKEKNGKIFNHVRFGAEVNAEDLMNDAFLCASITNAKDSTLYWHQVGINNFLLKGKSEVIETGFIIPPNLPADASINVFFWEPKGNSRYQIDNMYLEFLVAGIE